MAACSLPRCRENLAADQQGLETVGDQSPDDGRQGLYAGTGDGVYLLNAAQDHWKVVTTGLDEILVHALARTMMARYMPEPQAKGA